MKTLYNAKYAFQPAAKSCLLALVLLFSVIFARNNSIQVTIINLPINLIVAPNPFTPSCLYEKPGEFHLRNSPNGRLWAKNGGGCVFSFIVAVDPSLGDKFEASLKIFDSYGATVAEAMPDSNGSFYFGILGTAKVTYGYDIYWNGTYSGSSSDFVHEGTYTVQLLSRSTNGSEPIVLQENFYVNKPLGAKSNKCGTGYTLAFIPALGFKLRRPFKNAILKILRRFS